MLQLNKISKTYIKQNILKDINLIFNKNEKVMIVGPSGSGKTTLLNVIFKLDKPSSGDILFKNKNIQKINSNLYHTKIGFILQSYELIDDLNVFENIYLAQILNGKKDKKKIKSIINKVGLEHVSDHKINTLSGGEKQRVAIARALVNEPDVILADEPTGSLDSSTSKEIMGLIINLTKDKLLIMVTHNEYLAKKYGSRIITIQDGKIINDTNKQSKLNNDVFLEKRKKSINLLQIIKIALKNIFKNKVRFILTSLAVSIGLLGLSLVLLISDEANKELKYLEQNKIDSFPIVINKIPDIKHDNKEYRFPPYAKYKEEKLVKINSLTNEQLKYIENIDPTLLSGMSKQFLSNYLIMDEKYNIYEDKDIISLPISYKDNLFLTNNFDLVEGKYPKNNQEIVLIIDGNNQISNSLFKLIGNNAFNKKLKLINNNAIFIKNDKQYIINNKYENMYNHFNNINLKIVGIIRAKEDNTLYQEITGLGINESIINELILLNKNSNIIKDQLNSDYNLITKEKVNNVKKVLNTFYYNDFPIEISLFPKDYEARLKVIDYLNNDEYKIIYKDLASEFINLTKDVFKTISTILVLFSLISLIVIIFMIGILNYIKTLERSKEIGIYRILGASKKDIVTILNTENVIIAITSSLFSIVLAQLITKQIFYLVLKIDQVNNNYKVYSLIIMISIIICSLGGLIPLISRMRRPIISNIKHF